jgi:[NiFe] hydrogenase assembly HybE family chaperone
MSRGAKGERAPAPSVRVGELVARFEHIAGTRMAGVPILHPGLGVETVGFAPEGDGPDAAWVGVLITPWFMNLVRLPGNAGAVSTGQAVPRRVGQDEVDFIGAHDEVLGAYESCSLFSPMGGFSDAVHARETAASVLALLRGPGALPAAAGVPSAAPLAAEPVPARRAFLFGRAGAAAA